MSDNNNIESVPPAPPYKSIPAPPHKSISAESVAIVSVLVALVGSFLPWARVLFLTVNGTDGDGMFTAVLSAITLFLIYSSKRAIANKATGRKQLGLATSFIAIATAIYVYDLANLTSLTSDDSDEFFEITVQPGFGIIIGTIGAIVGTITCAILFRKAKIKGLLAS